ncbi:hypothetical protein EON81_05930 [bacterium]|nr:MAG: hypothetical protein EON81_05930 [bacterium]
MPAQLALLILMLPARPEAQIGRSSSPRLAKLARERAAFDLKVVPSKTFQGYEGIFSKHVSGQGIALCPTGVASFRFVFSDADDYHLLFQRVKPGGPRTMWKLGIGFYEKGKRPVKPPRGTLRKYLWHDNLYVVELHPTKDQRTRLDARFSFTKYMEQPFEGPLWVSFVRPDGRLQGKPEIYDPNPKYLASKPFLPILAQESSAFGLGKKRWIGTWKFSIRGPDDEY